MKPKDNNAAEISVAVEHRAFSKVEWLTYLGLLAVAVLLPTAVSDPFLLTVAVLTLMYATLGIGWNLVGGLMGLPLFCSALFFGFGAYSALAVDVNLDMTPWVGVVVGVVISMAVAWFLGIVTLQLQGHYFGVATFVIGMIAIAIFNSIEWVGGVQGLSSPIHEPGLFWLQWPDTENYYYLFLGVLVAAFTLSESVHRGRLGLYLRAIKHNPMGAAHLGVRVTRYRIFALMISAGVTSVAGSFYGCYMLFIDPLTVFTPDISVQIVILVLLGGLGYTAGPLLGAAILIPLGQYLNAALGFSGGGWNMAIFGLAVILIVILRPTGIIGYIFERRRARQDAQLKAEANP